MGSYPKTDPACGETVCFFISTNCEGGHFHGLRIEGENGDCDRGCV